MIKKPNVILITIDALRADHLGFMGYEKKVSPNIDALARESSVFVQAYTTGPVTPYSFPAILTSTYPLDYGGPEKIAEPRKLISEVLKEKGYITGAFHGNPFLSNFFGYNKGWDYFEYLVPASNPPTGTAAAKGKTKSAFNKYFSKYARSLIRLVFSYFPEFIFQVKYLLYKLGRLKIVNQVKAASLNQIAKEFIHSAKEKSPFFVWLHYGDVHDPYLPYDYYFKPRSLSPDELIGKGAPQIFLDKENHVYPKALQKALKKHLGKIIDLYDQGIKYTDEQLGDLMNFLKKEDLYQNSIIVITADHGDEFLEHGGASHSPKLYNELLHVPLLIKYPGVNPQVIDKKVSLIDLPSTLITLAGFEAPSTFKGKNLFEKSEETIFHQAIDSSGAKPEYKIACQTEEWKYILDYQSQKEALYNLYRDPTEQQNLSDSKPEIAQRMKTIIKNFITKNPL